MLNWTLLSEPVNWIIVLFVLIVLSFVLDLFGLGVSTSNP